MTSTTIIDANWMGQPLAIATALLESNGHHALIDPGPGSTLANLRERLAANGLSVSQLDAILLTHIHLDHAGATGALVRENPRLTVYVHRNGAPHMMDPSKLLHSAGRLWGDALPRLFGETLPVPAENLRILDGGEMLTLGGRKMDVADTPGHASHHVSYFDGAEGVGFIGDTAGIRIQNGPYILPATPPPDIDLELWDESFAAILQRKPTRLFLTHYGFSEQPDAHLAEFRERLHRWAGMAAETIRNSADENAARDAFVAQSRIEMVRELGEAGAEHHAFTAGLDLSFLGLARYLKKQQKMAAEKNSASG
ncbi:MAG TPA: MBL fold metallo-hydrolase [Candidatus Acidoferrum sp.]|jgi:glyoxylase-like metal-dependent hydrolase (beta-lactamase superfamily II)